MVKLDEQGQVVHQYFQLGRSLFHQLELNQALTQNFKQCVQVIVSAHCFRSVPVLPVFKLRSAEVRLHYDFAPSEAGEKHKTLTFIWTSCTGFSVFEAPSQNVCLFVCFCVVEEILVCSDGSQPEILQGLYCRRGDFIVSLFYISVWESCIYSLAGPFVSAGFRPGWWDWPVDLLQCDRVPGTTQLRLPNTRERP